MKRGYQITAALTALFLAGTAQAHTFGVHGAGFGAGLAHPFIGVDHLLAMVAVGMGATQLGGRAIWRVPLAFMIVMVLGLLIAVAVRFPLVASILLVGVFALFHGHAHGQELPQAASALLYSLGF